MKMKFILCLALILGAFPVASVSAEDADDLRIMVSGNGTFAFDLYQAVKHRDGNLFFSPYSVSTALAMTYAGARGETAKEMADVLSFSLEEESLHASFSLLQSNLNAIQDKGHITLNVSNSLWAQEGYCFLDDFIGLNKKYYGAGLRVVDFLKHTEEARQTINAWVEDETRQKIQELLKPGMLDSFTTLVLCNAVYFKGDWLTQFDKQKTKDADFFVSADNVIEVPTMNQELKLPYKDFDGFSAISLPYQGRDLSMIILLPEEKDGLAGLEKNLIYNNVKGWIDGLAEAEEADVLVSLPKFKTTSEFDLSKVLSDLGMPHAFREADFSGMTGKKDLFISRVVHKAFVDVNEEGTEAAAATAVVMTRTAVMSPPRVFRADHPFLFLIRDNQSGSILFVGRIADPRRT